MVGVQLLNVPPDKVNFLIELAERSDSVEVACHVDRQTVGAAQSGCENGLGAAWGDLKNPVAVEIGFEEIANGRPRKMRGEQEQGGREGGMERFAGSEFIWTSVEFGFLGGRLYYFPPIVPRTTR